MTRLLSCMILLCLAFHLFGNDPTLIPPKGWDCIKDQEQLPQKVHTIYIGTGKTQFSPSINIASEPTPMSCEQYLSLAKSYHEGQGDTRCKSLGTIQTKAGTAKLLQIDRATQWGNVRFIQAVLVCDQTAYVVTATCLQEEFASLSSPIFKSIQSFSLTSPDQDRI